MHNFLKKCLNSRLVTTCVVITAAGILFAKNINPIKADDTTTFSLSSSVSVYDVVGESEDAKAAVTNDATYGNYITVSQPTTILRDGTTYYLQSWSSSDKSMPDFTLKTVTSDNATIGFNMPVNNVTIQANYTTTAPSLTQMNYLPDGSVGTDDSISGTDYTLPVNYYDGISTYPAVTSFVRSDLFNDYSNGVFTCGTAKYGNVSIVGSNEVVTTSYTGDLSGNIPTHTIYEGSSVSGQAPKENSLVTYFVKAYNDSGQIFDKYSMYYLDDNGAQISYKDQSSAEYVSVEKYPTLLVSGDTADAYYVLVFKMPAHDVYFDFTYKDDESNTNMLTTSLAVAPASGLSATVKSYGNLIVKKRTTVVAQIYSSDLQASRTRILASKKTLGNGKIFFVKSSDGKTISSSGNRLYIVYDNDEDNVISSTELQNYGQRIQ